jgi:hypothetical protein
MTTGGIAMKIEHDVNNIKLTSSEIAQLWVTYIGDTMSKCVISYFEKTVQDPYIHTIVRFTLDTIEKHLEMASDIFNSVTFPIPVGFSEHDVNLNAPKLYSDTFMLNYIKYATKFGMYNQSVALSMAAREDVRNFFNEYIDSYKDINNRTTSILLEKGLATRPPYIPIPDRAEFVNEKTYMGGFIVDFLGKERPINTMEIAHAFTNIQINTLGNALITGFAQVAKNKDLYSFFERGKHISGKYVDILSTLLKEEDLPAPMSWAHEVLDSTIPPFSDKLMLFHITALIGYGMSSYGLAAANSMRGDITSIYLRFVAEVMQYSKDGMVMLINNGWLERMPEAVKRSELTSV